MPALPAGIEVQHSALVHLIAEVRRVHAEGATWEELARRLDELVATVQEHFTSEEQEMERAGYPLLVEHRANHDTFLRRLRVVRAECERPEPEVMALFMDLLENWFKNHERTADGLVLDYLAKGS